MRSKLLFLIILLLAEQLGNAQEKPALNKTDRIRLAETFRLADQLSERVWRDWTKAPFAVLLVTPDFEFLMRHPTPSADFLPLGFDPLLKSNVYYRKRTFPAHWLATFPAIKGSMVSTIVVGQAEQTSVKTSTPWVITLLHEHFHQLQNSQPNYYSDVAALDLSGGDQTGMWMLNFAFPYDRKEVQDKFSKLSMMLAETIQSPPSELKRKTSAYLKAREEFGRLVSEKEFRYLNFQFWQEGIARYTEYRIADLAAKTFRASKQFQQLPDYTPFSEVAATTYGRIFKQLRNQKLEVSRREVVYPFGAAEGWLLDRLNPKWRASYFVDRFDLGKLYPHRQGRRLLSKTIPGNARDLCDHTFSYSLICF